MICIMGDIRPASIFPRVMSTAYSYSDRILKGAKPSELPAEEPTIYHLVINSRTAKTLGFNIPQSLLLRAELVQ